MHMPVFTPAVHASPSITPSCFLMLMPSFFSKFIHAKNQVYQWYMEKYYCIIFLTMKATILDTHSRHTLSSISLFIIVIFDEKKQFLVFFPFCNKSCNFDSFLLFAIKVCTFQIANLFYPSGFWFPFLILLHFCNQNFCEDDNFLEIN